MEQPPNGGYEELDQNTESAMSSSDLAATRAVDYDCLARDSANQVIPRYLFVPRLARSLACGELVVEPVLGPVRVEDVHTVARPRSDRDLLRVAWSDDYGPCHPVGSYLVEQSVMVRVPDIGDRLLVRQGLDQAVRSGREVSGTTARRIAAHVHLGPRSALYGFAINGAIPEQLYDELNQVHSNQPAYRLWVAALARYCLDRKGTGPVPGWGPAAVEPEWRATFPPDDGCPTSNQRPSPTYRHGYVITSGSS